MIQIYHLRRAESVRYAPQQLKKLVGRRPHFEIAIAEVVEHGSSKNGSDSDKAGRHPSGINQIGRDVFMSLASATNKSNMVDSICMNHPDVLVV